MGIKIFFSTCLVACVLVLVSTSAQARKGAVPSGWYETTDFVAETTLPGMSLCHLVKKHHIAYLPYRFESMGYVMAENACKAETFFPLNATQVAELQKSGLIDPAIPLVPQTSLRLRLQSYLLYAVIGIVVVGGIAYKLGGSTGVRSRGRRGSKQTNSRMLAVMCQVAKCDGKIEAGEVAMIASTIKRLTGQDVGINKIAEIIRDTDLNNDLRHLSDIGKGLSPNDRLTVLEGALTVAVSDGVIAAEEYSFIQDLAQALEIRADDFRISLRRIAGTLTPQAA